MAMSPEQQSIWPQVLTEAERLLDAEQPCDSWTIADNLGEERDDVDEVVAELGEDRLDIRPPTANETIVIDSYNPIGDV